MALAYKEEWEIALQERLDHPTNWKEICRVDYTDTKVLHNPYRSTTPTVQSGTRGTAFSFQTYAHTDETIDITTYKEVSQFIDAADLAQSGYENQMTMATLQGQLLNEQLESAMLGSHASFTDVGDDGSGNIATSSTTAITVSPTNIDDIIRAIKRIIRKANGWALAKRNGVFVVWRPEDFEILEAFVQANGFTSADQALQKGTDTGMVYMGVYHYSSNDYTAGHLFAGVRSLFHLGIVKSTYGKLDVIENPAGASGGVLSGTGVHSRLDYAFKAWREVVPLLLDINVA